MKKKRKRRRRKKKKKKKRRRTMIRIGVLEAVQHVHGSKNQEIN